MAVSLPLCILSFAFLIFTNLTVRAIADRRISPNRETLLKSSARVPDSSRIMSRLAEVELEDSTGNPLLVKDSLIHAQRAVDLSPWDYRAWQLLAATQEMNGMIAEAEKSMRMAYRFAPNNLKVNWMLANILLRQNEVEASLKPFQTAVNSKNELMPIAFDLLWQASGGNQDLLESLTAKNSKARLMLVRFLMEQAQTDSAIELFRSVDRDAKLTSTDASVFMNLLIESGRVATARQLWVETLAADGSASAAENLIWNGGFENDLLKEFNQFDWIIGTSDYVRLGLDRETAHDGKRALKMKFAGKDTTRLNGEIRQLIVLKPNSRYRLECYARASGLVTPEGPRLAVVGQNSLIVASEPVNAEISDWQHLVIDFIAPQNVAGASISIVRIPRFSYDDPTTGIIWFDDFKLTEM